MQRRLFSWVLRNSAVASFTISGVGGSIPFKPKKISSKGTFEYGSLGASITSLEGIIGFLKLLPKVSFEINVEYQPSGASV
jgi:hypothetical protein